MDAICNFLVPVKHKGNNGQAVVSDPLASLYGSLRALLNKDHVVLHFVSATSGEGASTVAREFATLAEKRGNRRTLLIDGNLQNPDTSRKFGCLPDRGLMDSERNFRKLEKSLQPVDDSGLWVGRLQGAGAGDALQPDEMRKAYALFKEQFDLTVIDCPPISSEHYADLMPEIVDGVVLVIRAEATRPAIVAHAKETVVQLGGTVLGAVLNRRKDYIPKFIYRYL
ncbi:MAG: hypothetical protein P4M13_05665 [Alphaproteobacteria bacterium]|nr:hypothetical protein [Alphaproteobacteria bacterium]